ncbi:MAG TPA: hypothetical protein DD733_05735 [Clostridiales bacterium]|nr:metal ABC transporter permease [Eubacteriales bacterium]HBR31564.1 hypothetical protein [Clostridiales bacterium]
MLERIFEYTYLQHAVLACLFSSIVCGIIGVVIIEKKLIMMSGGIAHTAYGGVGLGYLLNIEPIIGAFIFALASALGIGSIKRRGGPKTDVIIGLLWSFGMACGVFFIGLRKGYAPDIDSYLFGNILSVSTTDIYLMLALSAVIIIVITAFFPYWKAYLFDEEFAAVKGINTVLLEYMLLVLISMAVVVLIRSVGIILVMALLTAPAATASLFTKKLKNRMVYAVILSLLFTVSGLFISYYLNIQSGATIVFVSVVIYFTSYVIRESFQKHKGCRNITNKLA